MNHFCKKDYREQLQYFCEEQISSIPHLAGDMSKKVPLFENQEAAMLEVNCALLEEESEMSIEHSCGSGKTLLEANLLIASRRAKKVLGMDQSQDLVLVVERSLLPGIRSDFEKVGIDFGIWGGREKVLDRPVIVSTIQALQKNKQKIQTLLSPENISLVIGDEADKYLTQARKEIVKKFSRALN